MTAPFIVPEPLTIRAVLQPAAQAEVDALLVVVPAAPDARWAPALDTLDARLDGDLRALAADVDAGAVVLIASRGRVAARRVWLARAPSTVDGDALRALGATLARTASRLEPHALGIVADFEDGAMLALIEGLTLGVRQPYGLARDVARRDDVQRVDVVVMDGAHAERLQAPLQRLSVLEGARAWTRNLVDAPPNQMTPDVLAGAAADAARTVGMTVRVHDEAWMRECGMGALLAVAQGSSHPPRMVVLEHQVERDDVPTLALVGKGVTFDSGGLSLKDRTAMPAMKGDMAGAAAVLGAALAIARLGLPIRLVAVAACVENMPDALAFRPSDVVYASDGTAIEITSTDAEGRLALADALSYAASFDPDVTIDVATLTGGAITALGKGFAAAGFTSDEATLADVVEAGVHTGERVWPMPSYDGYLDLIASRVADLKNGGVPQGSAGVAAVFLRRFAPPRWVHLDIAPVGFLEEGRGAWAPGATGFGVGLLTRVAEGLVEQGS